MNAVFSILLLAAILGFIVFLLSKKDQNRRSQYGPSGLSEFRTDLPLDDCFDRLDQHSPDDVFAYECRRENDGGFTLHLLSYWPTKTAVCRTWTNYKYTKKSEKSKSFCRNYFVRWASNLRSMNSSSIAGWNSGSL